MRNELIWLSTRQVAERTGRHQEMVRRACETGDLHGGQTKPGRSNWRVHRDCIEPWMFGQPCPHGVGGGEAAEDRRSDGD